MSSATNTPTGDPDRQSGASGAGAGAEPGVKSDRVVCMHVREAGHMCVDFKKRLSFQFLF